MCHARWANNSDTRTCLCPRISLYMYTTGLWFTPLSGDFLLYLVWCLFGTRAGTTSHCLKVFSTAHRMHFMLSLFIWTASSRTASSARIYNCLYYYKWSSDPIVFLFFKQNKQHWSKTFAFQTQNMMWLRNSWLPLVLGFLYFFEVDFTFMKLLDN